MQEVLCFTRHLDEAIEAKLALSGLIVDVRLILSIEWELASGEQLVDDDSEGPQIHFLVVFGGLMDFRGHVVRSSSQTGQLRLFSIRLVPC